MQPNLGQNGRSTSRWRRIGWLAGLVLFFMGISIAAGFVAYRLDLPPMFAAGIGQVAILLVPLLFALIDGDGFRILGTTGSWKAIDAAIIPGIVLVQFVGSGVTAVILQGMGLLELEDKAVTQLLSDFTTYSGGQFVLLALGLALLAGLSEELLFRGYLMTRLERLGLGAWSCILLSALIFGLVHWPGYGLLPSLSKAIWFGIPTGAYFWYRRSLGPLVVAHTLLDFLAFIAVYVAGLIGAGG